MTSPTSPAGLSVADVLDRAADLIEPEGKWARGVWGGPHTCMCAEGAIYAAVGSNPWMGEPRADCAADFFGERLPQVPYNRIASWNDAPGRTQAEVVAALRSAAEAARTLEVG